ncbi:MAG TPA: hypothetical protein VGL97_13405 [Bryobacteraceae bacterium]
MAEDIDDYRTKHFNELSPAQCTVFEDAIERLDDAHDDFTSVAIKATLNSIEKDIPKIAAITTQAGDALQHLKNVAAVAKIASSLAALAAAVTTADYGLIPGAIEDINAVLNKTQAS